MEVNTAFWKNKKVLVTGHTGFKGSWLCLWLQSLGAKVCGVAKDPYTIPNLFTLADVAKDMQSHIGDIRDKDFVQNVFQEFQPEIVIHMAAQPLVLYSYENPLETYETNVLGTAYVLEAARHTESVKAVINVTTDKCYDNQEWVWGYRENEPMGGRDPYSNSKGCSELVTRAYYASFYEKAGKGLASARAGNVIGGGDWSTDRLIADIMKSIVNNKPVEIRHPKAIRPWQHVLEPLSGYLLLAEKLYSDPKKYSGGWNLGPYIQEVATVEEITEYIFTHWPLSHVGWKLDSKADKVHEAHFLKLDITKALTELQWHPKLSLPETLDWLIAWYAAWIKKEDVKALTFAQIKAYQSKSGLHTVLK